MKKYYSNYEKIYSIKEIVRLLFRKVGVIAVATVICAGLLGITQISTNDTETIIALTDEEQQEVDKYISYLEAYETEKERLEDSYAYNLNPHYVITSYSQYYVKTSDEKSSYDVLNALIEYLRSGGLARDTAKLTDVADPDEIFDLIVLDVNDNQQNKEQVTSVFGIKFYAENEEFCNELNIAIKQAFEAYADSLDEIIAENDLILLSNSNVRGFNQYYYNWQNSKREQLNRMEDETQALYNELSSIQQNYISDVLDKYEFEDLDLETENDKVLKFTIMGAALGFLVSVGLLILYYMFDATVKTGDELQNNFDILYMGNLKVIKKGKWQTKVDHIIDGEDDNLETKITQLSNNINSICKKKSISKIGVIKENDIAFEKYFQDLQMKMKKKNIEFVCINDISSELDDFENVILVTVKEKSKCKNIINIVNLCAAKNIQIIGYTMFV